MHWFFTPRTFFILCSLFIFYATTIPWDMAHAPTLENVAWIPLWDTARDRLWSIPDMVQNVVFFMPFGFFGYLGLPWVKRRGPILGVIIMALMGLTLSLTVESLQTMSATRSPSATDLTTNFGGALIGAAIAGFYSSLLQERFRKIVSELLQTNPGLLIFAVYLVAVTAGALAPFIPSLDIGLLRANVRAFLDDPWGPKAFGALLTDGLLFAALAFLCAKEVPAYLGARRWFPVFKGQISSVSAALFGMVSIGGLAVVLEAMQMVIIGHSPGVQDAVVGLLAAILGGLGLAVWARDGVQPAKQLGDFTLAAPGVVLGFSILAPTLRAMQPFQFQSLSEAFELITVWQLVPFATLFENINLSTFRNVFEASAIYLPLGYAVHALGKRPWVGFAVCLGLAELLEVLQIPVAGRVFDITEGIYAGAMGVAGAWVFTSLQAMNPAASWQGDEPTNPTAVMPPVGPRGIPDDAATLAMQAPPRR